MNAIAPTQSTLNTPDQQAVKNGPLQVPSVRGKRGQTAHWLLQASHRIGAIALLATLGTWVQMYRVQDFHTPLAFAAGASDLGFCLALLARMFVHHNSRLRREANGIAIFNLVLFILAIYFIVFARLSVIRANAAAFFTPTELQTPK
jgi:hypothetical protein